VFLPEIDLHLHSTASDGIHHPRELVRMAKRLRLAAISITDHDTVAGVDEAISVGSELGVEVVPGMALVEFIRSKRSARHARAAEMVRRLGADGLPITMDEVLKVAQGGTLGRVHIARLLAKNGVVPSVTEGFNRYLKRGTPYYVPMLKPSPFEAVAVIREAGGIASLAHPVFIREHLLQEILPLLSKAGLGAIEALCGFDAEYGLSVEEHLLTCSMMGGVATDYQLARSGGSDFHGLSVKPQEMGSAHVPMSFLDELRAKRQGTAV